MKGEREEMERKNGRVEYEKFRQGFKAWVEVGRKRKEKKEMGVNER